MAQSDPVLFDRITVNEGLSHSDVNAIVQDKDGFIWIGTYNGLCKYDGTRMHIYRTDNSALSHNRILSLHVSSDSLLYIGTEGGGLNIYNPVSGKFTSYKQQQELSKALAPEVINHIFEDEATSTVWICRDNGVSSVTNGGGELYVNLYPRAPNNEIILGGNSFGSAQIVLATNQGMLLLDKNSGAYTSFYRDMVGRLVHTIYRVEDRGWLIGAADGLYLYRRDAETVEKIGGQNILSIEKDRYQQIWIGSATEGLYKLDQNFRVVRQFKADITHQHSLRSNEIKALYEDRSGILWIGTIGEGVASTNILDKKIALYASGDKSNPLSVQKRIITIAEDKNEMLWIGSRGEGFTLIDRSSEEKIHIDSTRLSIPLRDVSAFFQDRKGGMWIGTWRGLYLIKTDQVRRMRESAPVDVQRVDQTLSNSDISIYKITEDRDGQLWISSSHGVFHYVPSDTDDYQGVFYNYTYNPHDDNTIQDNFVTDIFADPLTTSKTIWVGTRKGLSKLVFDQHAVNVMRVYPSTHNGFGGEFVSVIHQDRKDQLWVVTLGGGLNKLISGRNDGTIRFERFDNSAYPFVNNEMESLLEDQSGNFWIGGYGITKFNPESGQVKLYTVKDRLQSNSFKIWAAYQLQSGEFVFGGVNGYNIFHPDSVTNNPIPPNVAMTDIKLFSKSVAVGDTVNGGVLLSKPIGKTSSITLPYHSSSISFEFAALHFTSPLHNHYRYKLEGFDTQWRYTKGHETNVSYTNIKPGTYRFVVYGANSDGVWGHLPAELELKITPPFWLMPWAYLIYVVLLLTAFVVFRNRTLRKIRERHELDMERKLHEEQQRSLDTKLQFFTDISHEIKTPLSLIAMPVADLLDNAHLGPATRSKLELANQNIERLLKLVEQILDFRKYDSDMVRLSVKPIDYLAFISELVILLRPLADQKNILIHCMFHQEGKIVVYADCDQLEKVIINVLANAIKFTPTGGAITVECTASDSVVKTTITDNGCGMEEDELDKIFAPFYQSRTSGIYGGTGIGLSLSKQIVLRHHGHLFAESTVGEGTSFHIELHTGYEHFDPSEITPNRLDGDDMRLYEPLPPLEAEESLQDTAATSFDKRAMILIAEDNQDFRRYIVEVLRREYYVVEAENGRLAYDLAISHRPDLVITDVVMPEMTGMELCEKLKSNMETSHIPVMMLTARDMVSYQISGFETGADAYITKPFNLALFRARVGNLVAASYRRKAEFKTQVEVQPSEITISTFDNQLLQRSIAIVEANMQDPDFGVDALCKEVGISRPQYYRKIKALVGLSPVHFIRSLRIKRAAQILDKDNTSVSDVMYRVGITNLSYFSKVFKAEFGVLPKQYKSRDKSEGVPHSDSD